MRDGSSFGSRIGRFAPLLACVAVAVGVQDARTDETPAPAANPAHAATTLAVRVDRTYDGGKYPFEAAGVVERLFGYAGFDVGRVPFEQAEASVVVTIHGERLGAAYLDAGGATRGRTPQTLRTGAAISGTIVFRKAGRAPSMRKFAARRDPPETVVNGGPAYPIEELARPTITRAVLELMRESLRPGVARQAFIRAAADGKWSTYSSSMPVRDAIIQFLYETWDGADIDVLVAVLRDTSGSPSVEQSLGARAVTGLVRMGERAVEPLIAALQFDPAQDDPEKVRWDTTGRRNQRDGAALALGRLRATKALPTLSAVAGEDGAPSTAAIEALGLLGDPSSLPFLLDAAERHRPGSELAGDARGQALARALGSYRDPRAVDALIGLLKRRSLVGWAEIAAAESLSKIGDPRAIPALREVADGFMADARVRQAARDALLRLGASGTRAPPR